MMRKWTFAVVIITQLLLYSHLFLLLIGVGLAKQECIIKYLLLYYYYYYYYYLINLKKLMFLEVDHSHQKLI